MMIDWLMVLKGKGLSTAKRYGRDVRPGHDGLKELLFGTIRVKSFTESVKVQRDLTSMNVRRCMATGGWRRQ